MLGGSESSGGLVLLTARYPRRSAGMTGVGDGVGCGSVLFTARYPRRSAGMTEFGDAGMTGVGVWAGWELGLRGRLCSGQLL